MASELGLQANLKTSAASATTGITIPHPVNHPSAKLSHVPTQTSIDNHTPLSKRFETVIAATIISLLTIILTVYYIRNTTESTRLITDHLFNTPNPSLPLPPLSTAMGIWIDLESYEESQQFVKQQKFRIRTGTGNETVSPRNSADFVKLTTNKRITLLGDSMTNQIYEALYGDMDHFGIKPVEKEIRHKFHVNDNENG
ncbi:hypothetical protein HDU81_009283, partial [Chytriomyces hyalinus]